MVFHDPSSLALIEGVIIVSLDLKPDNFLWHFPVDCNEIRKLKKTVMEKKGASAEIESNSDIQNSQKTLASFICILSVMYILNGKLRDNY